MQEATEVGKWVTDGKHTYPYNMFLDELVSNGTLKFCDKPEPKAPDAPMAAKRKPVTMSMDEREALAAKLGITVGDLGNMTAQELAEAEAEASLPTLDGGFPKA
jgi:hypothetical protein